MMSDCTKLEMAQRMQNSSPVGSAHRSLISAPRWFEQTLHFKGFAGGVPINTETTAVKPRVGVE
jgi:hypothetical protein